MAEPAEVLVAEAAEPVAAAPKKSRRKGLKLPKIPILLVGVIAGGVLAGGALGVFLIGPKVVGPRGVGGSATVKVGEKPEEPVHREPGFVREYENIIVNPSGSEGSHFLMATVGLELPDPKSQKLLEERDLQIRDTIISILSSQTMEQLAEPDARAHVKEDLAKGLMTLAGNPKWIEIYLPQFVIQ